jgi:hypothetical protein
MRLPAISIILFSVVLVAGSGCTHVQLQRNTVRQATTVADLHQQQVLDNLAKFVYDPHSLPHFAFADAGSANVADSGRIDLGLNWISSGFDSANLGLGASRDMGESWTLVPINDPRKLELMRCAYQRAIASCGFAVESGHCPHCQARFNSFYTADPTVPADNPATPVDESGGIVTDQCIGHSCWFGFGCKRCVPPRCYCTYIGHYCGVYVWVLPEGRDELTKLTLAILDYAIYEPYSPPQETVEDIYGPDGKTLQQRKVIYQQRQGTAYATRDGPPERAFGQPVDMGPAPSPMQREPTLTPGLRILDFERMRRALTP